MIKLKVQQITYEQSKPFILNIHYARRIPCIQYAYGLFDNDKIVGIVTYGQPASPSLCAGIAGKEHKKDVLELNRLVILPEYNGKNCASFLISKSLKMLPHRKYIVSYSDCGGWGHNGYVYQASNFYYTGTTKPRTDKYSSGHSRHYEKDEKRRQFRSAKHRYITITGTKKDKKDLLKDLKYTIYEKYPKGDNTNYDVNNPIPLDNRLGKIL